MASRILTRALPHQKTLASYLQQQVRRLSLHEYQSQSLLKEFGIPVPAGRVASTPAEVRQAIDSLGSGGRGVLKSQILKGGRGKGTFDNGLKGGIQVVESADEGEVISSRMLGRRLQTKQTAAGEGLVVNKLYVAEPVPHTEEWYLAMTVDRETYKPTIVLSPTGGGVDIEAVARDHPEQLFTFPFQYTTSITDELCEEIAATLKARGVSVGATQHQQLRNVLEKLHTLFVAKDATLLEINPLAVMSDSNGSSQFVALDAKFTIDNAAERRQADLFRESKEDAVAAALETDEAEAAQYGLVYVRMDGSIGNVVNGAGLAMATNDAIALYGGKSANFLDAGGQATKETMVQAFRIILRDPRVNVVLVNIYGGIIDCTMITDSILAMATELGPMKVPVVVRLQGTNSAEGLQKLEAANLEGFYVEADFGEAAKKAVELSTASL
ncbi:hypothetical protein SEUCBS139899_005403 [Sporothrix eucalyptigena]|uniref:ATP-grasp domain-containing protein n=1 Tax=Sporothrix eucalyptigena TaxID=1812306 RepID=A0ABP0CXK7_9PEZI